ncbi:type I restriction endonuclease [uncultured Rubinisphaera sp.]|uniref:type I restriction endonuclease n=1 Tax=uncultured Rubinisphaera sp. TaxID=1678686 RepID=UPI0030DD0679
MINEDQLEQLSLSWFKNNGWNYANSVDISPDGDIPKRNDYRVVVLKDRLAEAVARLNPELPQSAVDEVVHIVGYDHPREFESLSIRSDSGAKIDTRCVARVHLSQFQSTT